MREHALLIVVLVLFGALLLAAGPWVDAQLVSLGAGL